MGIRRLWLPKGAYNGMAYHYRRSYRIIGGEYCITFHYMLCT